MITMTDLLSPRNGAGLGVRSSTSRPTPWIPLSPCVTPSGALLSLAYLEFFKERTEGLESSTCYHFSFAGIFVSILSVPE